jgi:hypothetical protein
MSFSHPGQEGLDGEKRGSEVGVDRSSPVGLGDVFERSGPDGASASVGDEGVNRAQPLLDRVSHGFDLLVTGEVGDRSKGTMPNLGDNPCLRCASGALPGLHCAVDDGGVPSRLLAFDSEGWRTTCAVHYPREA